MPKAFVRNHHKVTNWISLGRTLIETWNHADPKIQAWRARFPYSSGSKGFQKQLSAIFQYSKTMPVSESKFRPSYTFQSKGFSVDFVAAFLVESTTKEHLKNGSISAHKLCKTVRLCEFQGLTMPKVLLDTRLKCQICIVTDLKGLPSRANPSNPPLQELLCNFLSRPWPNVVRHLLAPRCLPTATREKAIESQCYGPKSQRFARTDYNLIISTSRPVA